MNEKNKCPVCKRFYGEDQGDCFYPGSPGVGCYKIALENREREMAEALVGMHVQGMETEEMRLMVQSLKGYILVDDYGFVIRVK